MGSVVNICFTRLTSAAWAVFFGSMWAGFESRFNSILLSLAYHTKLLDEEAIAADIADAVRRHNEDSEKWEQQEREWVSKACLNT